MKIIPLFIGLFLIIHFLFAQDIILKTAEFYHYITVYPKQNQYRKLSRIRSKHLVNRKFIVEVGEDFS
jgi:hypothetical protein